MNKAVTNVIYWGKRFGLPHFNSIPNKSCVVFPRSNPTASKETRTSLGCLQASFLSRVQGLFPHSRHCEPRNQILPGNLRS